jgi:hypothetical protein
VLVSHEARLYWLSATLSSLFFCRERWDEQDIADLEFYICGIHHLDSTPLRLGKEVPRTYNESPFAQLAQNTAGEILVDFVVPRDWLTNFRLWVLIPIMFAAVPD